MKIKNTSHQTISLGNTAFASIREANSFYIDKTDFIRQWWESQDVATLITRPRRFGKSLNLNMLECFFSEKYRGEGELFRGLSIWNHEKYREIQGTYPVIFFSFADIKGQTFTSAREAICQVIQDLYAEFGFLKESERLSQEEKDYFSLVTSMMSDAVAAMSLKRLSMCLHSYYGKKVLIFLDEYDTPLQEAYMYGFWDELTGFMRGLFNSTFKTNPYLERALLTGITRVSKESIFSDLNNLTVITTTSEQYADCFGFTETEVFDALEKYGMSDRQVEVQTWYDGFSFGNKKDIYNPWSITCFLKEKKLRPYWANTSSNQLVGKLVREGSAQIKMVMEDLLAGKSFQTEIDEEIIFEQLQRKKGAIWSLFLAGGYLKVVRSEFDISSGRYSYELALTNQEVKMLFEDMVEGWFSDETVPYNDFLKAFLAKDLDYMNEYMNRVAEATFSTFDTGRNPSDDTNPERFYHGFVLGLIVELAGKYRVTSNRESGFGRYDVMLEPLEKTKAAFVLEFKVFNPRKEKTLEDTVANALQQINEKDYDCELLSRGIQKENIFHYGFAFEGKKVLIG
ncbi:AAA family ATPase [Blautia faecis]|nr:MULTISPECIES: AAA family ATPase [Clostridia]MCB5521983.1 ATP-binding protein [Blautia schinkii]NSD38052.1 AAA family ATPase [Blautia glucerasea]NSD59832.1 AAA family ATPase [Blautia faecis]